MFNGWKITNILDVGRRYKCEKTMKTTSLICACRRSDGNAHVIPVELFELIISGEMKITNMDDWEIITRTAFSEWLRGLETAAKTRVYKAACPKSVQSVASVPDEDREDA